MFIDKGLILFTIQLLSTSLLIAKVCSMTEKRLQSCSTPIYYCQIKMFVDDAVSTPPPATILLENIWEVKKRSISLFVAVWMDGFIITDQDYNIVIQSPPSFFVIFHQYLYMSIKCSTEFTRVEDSFYFSIDILIKSLELQVAVLIGITTIFSLFGRFFKG